MHFTGPPTITPAQLLNPYVRPPSKPWAFVCLNPFKNEWYEVLDRTPWGGWRPDECSFAKAAFEELLTLCRQLQQQGSAALPAADAVQQQVCKAQQQQQQRCIEGQAGSQSAASVTEACGGADEGQDCAVRGTVTAVNGCLSSVVCREKGFDAQLFLCSIAAMCSAAAGATGTDCL